jgi:hypothetical protein
MMRYRPASRAPGRNRASDDGVPEEGFDRLLLGDFEDAAGVDVATVRVMSAMSLSAGVSTAAPHLEQKRLSSERPVSQCAQRGISGNVFYSHAPILASLASMYASDSLRI